MRPTHVFRHGEWIPTDVLTPNGYPTRPEPPRTTHVISDTMPRHLKHMGNGRMYDSKSRFRQATRDSDCIEVGNDPAIMRNAPRPEPQGVLEDVARAYAEVKLVAPEISVRKRRRMQRQADLAMPSRQPIRTE